MAKFLVSINIRHADNPSEDPQEWVVQVTASSRSELSKKNLGIIEAHVSEGLGDGWVTNGARVMKKNDPRSAVEQDLVFKKGKVSNG